MEEQPTEPPVAVAGKIQPHQIALWLSVILIAVMFLDPQFLGRLTSPGLASTSFAVITWPGIWLARFTGLEFIVILWSLSAIYFAFYLPVKLWVTASHQCRVALVACVALYASVYAYFQWYSNRIDWSPHGLDPDRPGFEPQVVILAGKFDFWVKDSLVNQTKTGTGLFEIRMRGHDFYYCRKWHGDDWQPGAWFRVEIGNMNEGFSWGLGIGTFGTRGGGGSWGVDNDTMVLARRLWNGQHFIGTDTNSLVAEQFRWPDSKEEFSDLTKVGRWTIPQHIYFSNHDRIENYYIKKIEFSSLPGTNWFDQIMKKYADPKSGLRQKDLDEPGVAPGKDHLGNHHV